MKTFNQELKSALLAEIIKHREQDRVVQGTYGEKGEENFRGCAVGCSIHSLFIITGRHYRPYNHEAYETELGIPRILGELQDVIHEGLSDADFPTWPERFMAAVPIETDLSLVFPKFALWLLSDEVYGVLHKAKTDEEREIISSAIDLCHRTIADGEAIPGSVWFDLGNAANALVTNKRRAPRATMYLCFALNPGVVDRRRSVDYALLQHFYSSSIQEVEKHHKLCADKLIELLIAEDKNGI